MSDSPFPASLFTPLQFRRTQEAHFQARNDKAGWTRCFLMGWKLPCSENSENNEGKEEDTHWCVSRENSTCCAKHHPACPAQVCCQLAKVSACCKPAAKGRLGSGASLFETAERGIGVPLPEIVPVLAKNTFITHRCDIENHLAACWETRL